MAIQFFDEHPLARDGQGRLKSRIGTVFPDDDVIVTVPGIHATQRMIYLDRLDEDRRAKGEPPLSRGERNDYWENAVDLIMEGDSIQIRPDPQRMHLAFAADEVLQRLPVSKRRIRFLNVLNGQVREAIKRRGECWRITRLPSSIVEMEDMILSSKIAIGGREMYYYNRTTGTRYLTCDEFGRLRALGDWELRKHLLEIQDFSGCVNRMGNLEVDFFQADPELKSDLQLCDFREVGVHDLRKMYTRLCDRFRESVIAPFRTDNMANAEWRFRMFASLLPVSDALVTEEELLGLSSEFCMQVQWLPGARIEDREVIFDSVLEETPATNTEELRDSEEISRGLIHNLLREYGDLEYVNVGCIVERLSRRPPPGGRRGVYLIEMKLKDSNEEVLKIVRLQKWGVGERLDDGKQLLQAVMETEEYMDYILDRRLGCRQLGMNLVPRVTARKLREIYGGKNPDYHGTRIWTPYFERDYIRGMATDKISMARFEDSEFAVRFARLLGQAAAPNIIVGRWAEEGDHVTFDDGDEILVEDEHGLPASIVVADITGSFRNFSSDLRSLAAAHAEPIRRVGPAVKDPEAFAETYIAALVEAYTHIRCEYFKRRQAFDTLFRNQPVVQAGSFAYRWERVLQRLDAATPRQIEQAVRDGLTDAFSSQATTRELTVDPSTS